MVPPVVVPVPTGVSSLAGLSLGKFRRRYTYAMADDSLMEEIQDNTKEAGLRLRASLTLLRAQGKLDDVDHRELVSRLSTSLAMVEAAYMEARRLKS